jgi:hypothetical protein
VTAQKTNSLLPWERADDVGMAIGTKRWGSNGLGSLVSERVEKCAGWRIGLFALEVVSELS